MIDPTLSSDSAVFPSGTTPLDHFTVGPAAVPAPEETLDAIESLVSEAAAGEAALATAAFEPEASSRTSLTGRLLGLVRLMRPHQWTKNGLCLAGAIFSGRMFDLSALELGVATALIFSLGSSSIYVFNDILDRERDRRHPKKRHRPIASGAVSVPAAAVLGIALAAVSLAGGWLLGGATLGCLLLYLANNLAYSTRMKHLPLFDVLSIAMGFVLRLLAGVYVLSELPTAWIVLCTFFLATFLGFAKRRAELCSLNNGGAAQRPVLSSYSIPYLDSMLNSAAVSAILCYALFTVTSGKNPALVVTLPIVYYAILHYKRLVMVDESGEEPDRLLLRDPSIACSVVLWLGLYLTMTYCDVQLFR